MLLPIVLVGTAAAVAWKKHKRKPMTVEQKTIFTQALKDSATLGADKLKTMAQAYRSQGFIAEAKELEKRAALLNAPPEIQEARKAAFKKAMNSVDAAAVKKVAAAFQAVGHYEAASKLRNYAKGLVTHYQKPASKPQEPTNATNKTEGNVA